MSVTFLPAELRLCGVAGVVDGTGIIDSAERTDLCGQEPLSGQLAFEGYGMGGGDATCRDTKQVVVLGFGCGSDDVGDGLELEEGLETM
ncbi:MAG: hypothetical protein ACI9WU_004289 [Myxococcota bacterium]